MRFFEILESFIDLFEAAGFDTEHYGNWIVDMSVKPIVMGNVTGPKPTYVARITHKRRKDIVFYGTGDSQGAAKESSSNRSHR